MAQRTYSVEIEIKRDDVLGDRAHVTVLGHTYRYPYHWEDDLKSLARRVVVENYCVESAGQVVENRRGRTPRGSFLVTATV